MPEPKTALITGTSSGFGRELVSELLRRGWSVAAGLRRARDRRGLFAAELGSYPERLRVLPLDVNNSVERLAARGEVSRFFGGRLDCLINNAGYGLFGALENLSEEQLRSQFETNFFAPALLTRLFLPLLRKARGRVINISSVVGTTGLPLTSAYCSSKFALEGLSEALYHELRPHGVQVALVEPGRFRTRFGDNVVWGAGAEPAYERQTRNYRALKDRLSAGRGVDSRKVVLAVARLAESARMPLRTRCGMDARLGHLASRVLPAELKHRMSAAVYERMMLR